MRSTVPRWPPFTRWPASAPSGWPSPGHSALRCPCASSTLPPSTLWPGAAPASSCRCRMGATPIRPARRGQPIHWPSWRWRRVTTMPNGGGKTWSSTAAINPPTDSTPLAMHLAKHHARHRTRRCPTWASMSHSWPSARRCMRCGRCTNPRVSPSMRPSGGARRTCAPQSAVRSATATGTSLWCVVRGMYLRWKGRSRRGRLAAIRRRCVVSPRSKRPSPGFRGPTAGSHREPVTARASLRRAGITTSTPMLVPT